MTSDSQRVAAAKGAAKRAVLAGKGASMLTHENNYRISCYREFVGCDRLTD